MSLKYLWNATDRENRNTKKQTCPDAQQQMLLWFYNVFIHTHTHIYVCVCVCVLRILFQSRFAILH